MSCLIVSTLIAVFTLIIKKQFLSLNLFSLTQKVQSLVEFSEGTGEDKMPLVKNCASISKWFFVFGFFFLEFVLIIPSNHIHFVAIIRLHH